jgi:carbon storage regulator
MALLAAKGLGYRSGGFEVRSKRVKAMGSLVLGRRPGQQISIGDSVTVTVVDTRGEYVRLHISAPTDVTILRTELVHRDQIGGVQ